MIMAKLDTPKYSFNVDSNRELANYLLSEGVKLKDKTERGDYKVDIKTLDNYKDIPVVEEYLNYQEGSRNLSEVYKALL
jgi:hypothetical protein